MKIYAIIFTLLLASVVAEPFKVTDNHTQRNLVVDAINLVFKVVQGILAKHDPFELTEFERESTILQQLNAGISIKDLKVCGFSQIALNELEYARSLRFDVSLPKMYFELGNARIYVGSAEAEVGGRIAITQVGFAGDIDLNLGRAGISVNRLKLRLQLEGVEADVRALILNGDFSDLANDFLNHKLVPFVEQNREKISELLEFGAVKLIEIVSNLFKAYYNK